MNLSGPVFPVTADAAIITFNSGAPANNTTTRDSWLSTIGLTSSEYVVDFESGFVNLQNISGGTGLFPGGLVITDTAGDQAIIRTRLESSTVRTRSVSSRSRTAKRRSSISLFRRVRLITSARSTSIRQV